MISWHGSRSSVLLKRTRRSRAIYSPHPFTVKKLCSLHPLKVKVQKTTWKKTAGKHSGQLCLTGPEIFGSDLQTSKHTEWMCFYNPKDLDWVKMTSLVEVCFVYTVPFMKQNVVNISHVNLKALKWRVLVFFFYLTKKGQGPVLRDEAYHGRWDPWGDLILSASKFLFFITSTKTKRKLKHTSQLQPVLNTPLDQ